MGPREVRNLGRRRSIGIRFAGLGSALAGPLALAAVPACESPRAVPSDEALRMIEIEHRTARKQLLDEVVARLVDRIEREADEDGRGSIDILAMSGGADYGAFGAGALIGWSEIADPDARRPEFDAVTGVSTGALLAPFAFLGTDADLRAVESLYRDPQSDWIVLRGLLPFMPWNASLATIPGLERALAGIVDERFVERIAEGAREGRALAISATDLDLGRRTIWDLGREAAREGDPAPILRRLIASAAVPVLFPPILIEEHLYVDGGVTANLLLRLAPHDEAGFVQRWRREHPGRPWPRMRYWIILNNLENHPPRIVQPRWGSIVAPALEVVIRSATISEIRWLAAEADYCNAVFGTEIEVRVLAIPDDWRPPVEGAFRRETMNDLADLGRAMGRDPASWQLWTVRSNAGLGGASRPVSE